MAVLLCLRSFIEEVWRRGAKKRWIISDGKGYRSFPLAFYQRYLYQLSVSPSSPSDTETLHVSCFRRAFFQPSFRFLSLLNPYIGILADRISVRYFIIAAPALTAIPMSLIGLAPTYTVLLILLFLTGISVAIFHVPAPVLISEVSREQGWQRHEFLHDRGAKWPEPSGRSLPLAPFHWSDWKIFIL